MRRVKSCGVLMLTGSVSEDELAIAPGLHFVERGVAAGLRD